MDADQLIASERDHGVALLGPTPQDQQGQARTQGAFSVRDFTLDWDREVATGPAGRTSQSWTADRNQGRTVMRIRVSTRTASLALSSRAAPAPTAACSRRAGARSTPPSKRPGRETGKAFAMEYRRRAGIEGTLSAGMRSMHLRRSRYVGLAKTHLQHVLTAAATNLVRLGAWLAGKPLARTRQSAFLRLMAQPA